MRNTTFFAPWAQKSPERTRTLCLRNARKKSDRMLDIARSYIRIYQIECQEKKTDTDDLCEMRSQIILCQIEKHVRPNVRIYASYRMPENTTDKVSVIMSEYIL